MPLVSASTSIEEPAVDERRQTARKIKPEYAEGSYFVWQVIWLAA